MPIYNRKPNRIRAIQWQGEGTDTADPEDQKR